MSAADNASDALADHIGSVIHDHGQGMVTKWITLVEVINQDGEREMWSLSSDGLASWEALGMLDFSATARRASIGVDGHEPTEEDE